MYIILQGALNAAVAGASVLSKTDVSLASDGTPRDEGRNHVNGKNNNNNTCNNRSFNMVKTSAQLYKHIIHLYVYNHIQRTACHARQQQHKV